MYGSMYLSNSIQHSLQVTEYKDLNIKKEVIKIKTFKILPKNVLFKLIFICDWEEGYSITKNTKQFEI